MLKNTLFSLKSKGVMGTLSAIRRKISPQKAICFQLCEQLISDKVGLEIGGPSSVFQTKGILPIYPIVKQLDNCNFAGTTTWEGNITEGLTFHFNENSLPGRQYLTEAADLSEITSATYDFILSSHMLEHTANPLQALSEWIRVLKDDGILVIILPHKDGTFDHQRPTTHLDHLIEDFENEIKENDLTHLSEILKLHDLSKDCGSGTFQSFKERSEKNFENRCLHHHVFDTKLAIELLNYQGLQIHAVEAFMPCHIVLLAQKITHGKLSNENFLKDDARYKFTSPFRSDKLLVT
jgi:SAM-dependent methyltransferase